MDRRLGMTLCLLACCLVGCVATRRDPLIDDAASPLFAAATQGQMASGKAPEPRPIRLPQVPQTPVATDSPIRHVSHEEEPVKPNPPRLEQAIPESLPTPSFVPSISDPATPTFPIDLPTALRLADADNLQVALAREQVQAAYAEYRLARAMWLPSLRGGVHWNKHEGNLLSSGGEMRNNSRTSLYAGAGAFAVGGGSPVIPGVFANFHVADAIFAPLAAQQSWGAREQAATAARNNTLLDVSLAYMELVRSAQDVAIAQDLHEKVYSLWKLTDSFVRTGQSAQADADRMRVEVGLREIDVRRSQEALAMASARLAQLLRLGPCVRLDPLEPAVMQLCWIDRNSECCDLVAQALLNRPELLQNRYLVGEAVERLRREKFAPLVPSILLGASYGGFGGGLGSNIDNVRDRFDLDAVAFWELRNLGIGTSAVRQGANSRLRQARIQELASLDLVAREVTEAHAQLQIRSRQTETAKDVVRYAMESYEHNLGRIRAGTGLPIEVLQSVQALLQARREYLRSLTDYNNAQFTMQRALGWPATSAVVHEDSRE